MGRSKERGIGEAKNAAYPIKDQVKRKISLKITKETCATLSVL